jgi:hypothetical protein
LPVEHPREGLRPVRAGLAQRRIGNGLRN